MEARAEFVARVKALLRRITMPMTVRESAQ
jgi:hypothetical protein